MSENKNHSYELLVLFPQSASADLQACADYIREILDRAAVELLALRKWDERRLAYDIRGNKRGLYFLAYFSGPGSSLVKIERDFNLSERVLRTLVLRVEDKSEDELRATDGREQLADEIRLRSTGQVVPDLVSEVESAVAVEEAIDDLIDE